jgi:hypothetical protein
MTEEERKSEQTREKEPQQDVELAAWYKKIEIIGISIKSLERERNRTTQIKNNTHQSAFYK